MDIWIYDRGDGAWWLAELSKPGHSQRLAAGFRSTLHQASSDKHI